MDERHDFGWALAGMRSGLRLARPRWGGVDRCMFLVTPDGNGPVSYSYLCVELADGTVVSHTPGNLDLLAEDWFVVSD